MDSRKVASELIELSGGTSNIKNVTHCSTRLRFIIKDKSAVEVEAIKKCEGVLGVVFTTDELQMVFGKNVIPVYTEASKIYEAAGNKAGGVVPDGLCAALGQPLGNRPGVALTAQQLPLLQHLLRFHHEAVHIHLGKFLRGFSVP